LELFELAALVKIRLKIGQKKSCNLSLNEAAKLRVLSWVTSRIVPKFESVTYRLPKVTQEKDFLLFSKTENKSTKEKKLLLC
jgi:hypothetical protein